MKTSYFAKSGTHKDAVGICCGRPHFYKGKMYTKLGPKRWFLKKYKEDGDKDFYTKQYYKEVLDKLNPAEVYEELGEDAIIAKCIKELSIANDDYVKKTQFGRR